MSKNAHHCPGGFLPPAGSCRKLATARRPPATGQHKVTTARRHFKLAHLPQRRAIVTSSWPRRHFKLARRQLKLPHLPRRRPVVNSSCLISAGGGPSQLPTSRRNLTTPRRQLRWASLNCRWPIADGS